MALTPAEYEEWRAAMIGLDIAHYTYVRRLDDPESKKSYDLAVAYWHDVCSRLFTDEATDPAAAVRT